jgi:type IV secretory pathway VirD2 relaxase
MSERDDERFRLRPRPPRNRGTGRATRFVNRVLTAATKAGPLARASGSRPSPGANFGRGVVASRLAVARQAARNRRVAIKVRLVKVGVSGRPAMQAHLRYIERAGVTPEGGPGHAYGAVLDNADTDAFSERCTGDRHQFRCIVAPEEATSLGDLKAYTRGLMGRVEQDLATGLDWVAVDHWDTDNPHTHVVIRGKDEAGHDLIIARDYISHGLRARASALATEWLGPRTDREIQAGLDREVTAERWTSLDRQLHRLSREGTVGLRQIAAETTDRSCRARWVGRLQQLTRLGLAHPTEPGSWRLEPAAERTLRALGERGDIIRTMQRALGSTPVAYTVFDPSIATQPLTGRVAAKGLSDDHHDHRYLVLDGVDGRAHFVRLPPTVDGNDLPLGSVVSVTPRTGPRASDQRIQALAPEGIYRPAQHLAVASAERRAGQDPDEFVAAHVRRLEALRRAGIAERLPDGKWRVPADLVVQGQRYDQRRGGRLTVELASAWPIERQVRAIGATWLDRELVAGNAGFAVQGFGGEARQALTARTEVLIEQQLVERRGSRLVIARDLLTTLQDRELAQVGGELAATAGRIYRPLQTGTSVAGVYRQRLQLASGQFALLDDGQQFSLVPWRPVLAPCIGHAVRAVVRGNHVTWQFGPTRGLTP